MKIAIIGSRGITDIDIAQYINEKPECVISGGAKGVDTLAAQYARNNGIKLLELRPNYAMHGRAATFIRNRQIVENADKVLAFWDGQSKGTQYTINHAKKLGKQVQIIRI